MPVSVKPSFSTSKDKKMIAILSIDGGGVRGIIPAVILQDLEKRLQALEDKNGEEKEVRIADYFDMIVGTSAGSIVTALLTTPAKDSDRPLPASKIVSIFQDQSKDIFKNPESQEDGGASIFKKVGDFVWQWLFQKNLLYKFIINPKFDSSQIKSFTNKFLGDTKLDETLKPVVIPAYRTGNFGPYVFSSEQEKYNLKDKVFLRDVVLSSTAAPYYFIPHTFNLNGKDSTFADGGMAAVNNPTMVAIGEASKVHGLDYNKYMVLSLGTGIVKLPEEQDIRGGLYAWLVPFIWYTGKSMPIISMPRILETLFNSTTTMTDIYMTNIFSNSDNYLRIQESNLDFKLGSLADTTPDNITGLIKVGEKLLTKPISKTNTQTGDIIEQKNPIIGDALQVFAEKIYEEKKKWNKPDARGMLKVQN